MAEHEQPEPLQPASERDLQQHPPRDAACAAVRAWLRDHADGDLASELRERVDEHVHRCRDCSLALGRAELETLRLRALPFEPAEPPASFTESVLAAVRDEREREVEVEARVPGDFTPRVMQRVRMEWARPNLTQMLWRFGKRYRFLVGAAAAAVAAVLVLQGSASHLPQRLVVQSARNAWIETDRGWSAAKVDQIVGAGQALEVHDGGSASAQLPGASRWDRPAFLELEDHTRLQLPAVAAAPAKVASGSAKAAGQPPADLLLHDGALRVLNYQTLRVEIEDAGIIELEPGDYGLHALPIDRFDGALSPPRVFRAVRLEVTKGTAHVLRGDLLPQTVTEGQVAHFDPWSEVTFEPLLGIDRVLHSRAASPVLMTGTSPVPGVRSDEWVGRVVEVGTEHGVAGASIELVSVHGSQNVRSDAEGRFRLAGLQGLEGTFAVLQVTPAGEGLGSFGPAPLRLLAQNAGSGNPPELAPVALERERLVRGQVVDEDQRILARAAVEPCLLDEVFGLLQPLAHLAREADENGQFELHGLPRTLPPHVSLILLSRHDGYPVTACTDLAGHTPLLPETLAVVMQRPRELRFSGLPASTSVDVLQSIVGLPLAAMSELHHLATNALGEAVLAHASAGKCWLRQGDGQHVVPLVALQGAELPTLHPGDAQAMPAALERWLARHAQTGEETPGQSNGGRFATVQRDDATTPAQYVSVKDALGPMVRPGTRIFMVLGQGEEVVFLGEFDGSTSLPFHPPQDGKYQLVGISPDGALAVLPPEHGALVSLAAVSPGSAVLGKTLQPSLDTGRHRVLAYFEMEPGGMLPGIGFYRVLDRASDWRVEGLVAGTYKVTVEDDFKARVVVTPGGIATIDAVGGQSGSGGKGDGTAGGGRQATSR